MPTIREAYLHGRDHLAAGDSPAPGLEAEVLLRHVLVIDRARLYAHWESDLPAAAWAHYQDLLLARSQGRPIHYIVGEREFMGLQFAVDERVMIPRPETEILVEQLIERVQDHPTPILVDVGTGSGCIAVSLAHFLQRARIVATDISAPALEVAHANASRHAVQNRVTLLEGDLLQPLPLELHGRIDAIASNPPYIPLEHAESLPKEIRDYEPAIALFAPGDGTVVHRRLLATSPTWLVPGGTLAMEVGLGQGPAVAEAMQQDGQYTEVHVVADLAGVGRVVIGTFTGSEGGREPGRN